MLVAASTEAQPSSDEQHVAKPFALERLKVRTIGRYYLATHTTCQSEEEAVR
jgi:hypothetical protein